MNVKYLVASPGRTGSIFVANTIATSLNYTIVFDSNLLLTPAPQDNRPLVYHSHDATLQLNDEIIVIQPYRRNIFNAITSAVISEKYREWHNYTGNQQPFNADLTVFKEQYIWHKYWGQMFDQSTNYIHKVKLCFDEFVGNSSTICNSLNIPLVHYVSTKSPYKNSIINIDELVEYYNELEKEFTTNIPEIFNTIHEKKIIKNTYEQK